MSSFFSFYVCGKLCSLLSITQLLLLSLMVKPQLVHTVRCLVILRASKPHSIQYEGFRTDFTHVCFAYKLLICCVFCMFLQKCE